MRARSVAAAYLVAVLGACGGSNNGPSLTITPDGSGGALAIAGPTDFKATLLNSDATITWTVTGGGSVSTMTGDHTVFVPPAGTGSETLTATAGKLTASVTIASAPLVLAPGTIPGLSAPVTVSYDAEDIPHVNCAQAADCLTVQGYLQIRDRLFPMEFLRHVARSNLSSMIGVAGLSQDVQLRTLFVTRAGHRIEDDLALALDPPTKALLDAFLAGVNAYITQLQSSSTAADPLPGEYLQLPYPLTANDLVQWTEADVLAIARLQQFQLSETIEEETGYGTFAAAYGPGAPLEDLGKLAAWIRAAAPPTEQAHTLAPTPFMSSVVPAVKKPKIPSMSAWGPQLQKVRDSMLGLRNKLRPLRSAVGSNNWVVAAAKSATGVSMVANDPHLGLQYPPLFHLIAMTSANAADNLNLTGGSFPGIPGALVGRGANVGWGVTVVGYDVTDLYLETLTTTNCATAAAGVPCTVFNNQPVAPIIVPESYTVRIGPGSSGLVDSTSLPAAVASTVPPATIIVPQHGPIISLDATAGTAVSVRWTGQEGNTQDLKAIWGLNTATSVTTAMQALAFFSTGAQNFVLADDQGNIGYDPHALVPVRNFADARVVGANVIPPWFPLPGGGSAEWGDGTDNCAAGSGVASGCWIRRQPAATRHEPGEGLLLHRERRPGRSAAAYPTTTIRSLTRPISASTGMTRAASARRASTSC